MTNVDLQLIKDNPYQPREADDSTHIENLARSIAADGLLQVPTARRVNGHYELAFGHSRRKAFEWLTANWKAQSLPERFDGYSIMPLNVEELDERQMYRHAVTENVQRKDLAPTEVAKALKEYMEKFNASSKEAGELFGMSDATVRGMVRLLELPDEAQNALDTGKISQGTARTLLSMQKIASVAAVKETVKYIEKNPDQLPEDLIDESISELDNAVELFDERFADSKEKPRAIRGGWLLDMKNFPNRLLEPLSWKEAIDALEIGEKDSLTIAAVNTWLMAFRDQVEDADQHQAYAANQIGLDRVSKLQHLINPPACAACPFYTKVRGSHYCGVKVCFERKQAAWGKSELEQASKRTKIAIYTETDGTFRPIDSYYDKALFEKRHEGLRLISGQSYERFEAVNNYFVTVVATGDALNKLKLHNNGTRAKGKKTEKEKAEARAMRLYRQLRKEMMWEYTAIAMSLFDNVPLPALERLNSRWFISVEDRVPSEHEPAKNASAAEKLEFQKRDMVWKLISEKSTFYSREKLTDQVEEMQEVMPVKLPSSFIKQVAAWDAEIESLAKPVSTETNSKSSGKRSRK